ncbi:hypothetical protein ILUMI_10272 [Ignelater luminosus]|uniref:PiggyBac transposable element-derived protein domain-containing protein n=1 Tax=Ignelater luminosus TaxID=2038154 RepID=A0A8K0D7G2_IGNLU|nr:hypothetical protein ILUMI_10272 [Ignelater luminosus]
MSRQTALLTEEGFKLPQACTTRWNLHSRAVSIIKRYFSKLDAVFESIIEDENFEWDPDSTKDADQQQQKTKDLLIADVLSRAPYCKQIHDDKDLTYVVHECPLSMSKNLKNLLLENADEEELFIVQEKEDSEGDDDRIEDQEISKSEQSEEEGEKLRNSLKQKNDEHRCFWEKMNTSSRQHFRKNVADDKQNIVTHLPGPRGATKSVNNPLAKWVLFNDKEILEVVLVHTIKDISSKRLTLQHDQVTYFDTTMSELRALIGLLYLMGVQKANHLNCGQQNMKLLYLEQL